MNIYTYNNNNISMRGKGNNWFRRVEQWVLDKSPSVTAKEGEKSKEKWDKFSHWVSDPMWNRGIMGVTALITQPPIDYYNHRVDDETRTVARNRTIAKILAGTGVGMFVVRGPIYKMVEKMTNPDGSGKWDKKLLPKAFIDELKKDKNSLKNYRAAIAMALALAAMCITNFVLDAPLTIMLTNLFNKKSGVAQSPISSEKEVING